MIKIFSASYQETYQIEDFNFPVGELHIRFKKDLPVNKGSLNILWEYANDLEFHKLGLLCHTAKLASIPLGKLELPYVPGSRQDRVTQYGECFTLKYVADFINSLGFERVTVKDPHSDVTPSLINNCTIISQADVFSDLIRRYSDYWLISPDAGAYKKISKLPEDLGIIQMSKVRDTLTGSLSLTCFDNRLLQIEGKTCIIVDDIVDAGGTFIAIAKELKKNNPEKIVLMATHGFFTKGLEVFDEVIDEIYTHKGKIK